MCISSMSWSELSTLYMIVQCRARRRRRHRKRKSKYNKTGEQASEIVVSKFGFVLALSMCVYMCKRCCSNFHPVLANEQVKERKKRGRELSFSLSSSHLLHDVSLFNASMHACSSECRLDDDGVQLCH
jgi:hypothetical protein